MMATRRSVKDPTENLKMVVNQLTSVTDSVSIVSRKLLVKWMRMFEAKVMRERSKMIEDVCYSDINETRTLSL